MKKLIFGRRNERVVIASAMEPSTCYICYQDFTQDNPICDTGCACSHSMDVHYACIRKSCFSMNSLSCSICKELIKDVVLEISEDDCAQNHIKHVQYLNGKKHGTSTIYDKYTNKIISQTWYEDGKKTEYHEYCCIAECIDTIIRFDDGNVTEYWRYNSWGEEVDYEDYSLDPMEQYQMEISDAIAASY